MLSSCPWGSETWYLTLASFERTPLYLCLYFTFFLQKRTGGNLKALQLVTVSQNLTTRSWESHALSQPIVFSNQSQPFVFPYCYVWYMLYIPLLCWVYVVYTLPALGVGFLHLSGQWHFSSYAGWFLCTFPSICPLSCMISGGTGVAFGIFF